MMLKLSTIHKTIAISACVVIASSCKNKTFEYDASGTFESTEILVSSEASGKIMQFDVTEGLRLKKGDFVGFIDTVQLYLQKMQLSASKNAINAGRPDVQLQTAAIKEQIAKAELEKNRITNLLEDNAATRKQADDIDSQIKVLKMTLAAQSNTLSVTTGSIDAQSSTVDVQIAQIDDRLEKSKIINPIDGTVLAKYAEESEITAPGKPLYKIADTRNMFLRAYVIASQLESVKTGGRADVIVTYGDKSKTYAGKVAWISDKAEFTPKTIQTKNERQNLVYAVKIAVENTDGLIKIGMYADVNFKQD